MPQDPDETPPEASFPVDEAPTLVTCMACGGNFQILTESDRGHRMSICPWCTRGSMSAKQNARWLAHRQGRPRSTR